MNCDFEEIINSDVSKSEKIRKLASQNLEKSKIAQILDIRYQHVYNVLKRSTGVFNEKNNKAEISKKEDLSVNDIKKFGFSKLGEFILNNDILSLDTKFPTNRGVYAIIINEVVVYVGSANTTIHKRFYSYLKPGPTQRTSQRLNKKVFEKLKECQNVEVYAIIPTDFEWEDLPVDAVLGIEGGLIRKYKLPWNIRGTF